MDKEEGSQQGRVKEEGIGERDREVGQERETRGGGRERG